MRFPFESKDIIKHSLYLDQCLWKPPFKFIALMLWYYDVFFLLPCTHLLYLWWFYYVMHANICIYYMGNESPKTSLFTIHTYSIYIFTGIVCIEHVNIVWWFIPSKWIQAKTTLAHMLDKCIFGIAQPDKFLFNSTKMFQSTIKRTPHFRRQVENGTDNLEFFKSNIHFSTDSTNITHLMGQK